MNWIIGTLISAIALLITVIANIVAITKFATTQKVSLDAMKESFKEFKEGINHQIDQNMKHTEEHIKRLEEKQDKHNNLIERMAIVEQSAKSAHHRLDEMKGEKHGR